MGKTEAPSADEKPIIAQLNDQMPVNSVSNDNTASSSKKTGSLSYHKAHGTKPRTSRRGSSSSPQAKENGTDPASPIGAATAAVEFAPPKPKPKATQKPPVGTPVSKPSPARPTGTPGQGAKVHHAFKFPHDTCGTEKAKSDNLCSSQRPQTAVTSATAAASKVPSRPSVVPDSIGFSWCLWLQGRRGHKGGNTYNNSGGHLTAQTPPYPVLSQRYKRAVCIAQNRILR